MLRGWPAPLLFALGLVVGRAGVAAAVEPGAPFDAYVRAAWPSVAHASAVRALLPARNGYLWIGTSEGVVRFDGQAMTAFDRGRFPAMVAGNIERVFEASDGTLWFGSRGMGLSRLAGSTVTALDQRGGLASDLVRAFAETADGTIWVGSFGGVVRLARGTVAAPRAASAGLPDLRVDALAVDAAGVVWAGTRGGLARWDPGGQRWQTELGQLPEAVRVNALLAEPGGALWVGTGGAGLLERRNGRWRSYTTRDGLASNTVSAVTRERGGRLWVAARDGGLHWLAGERLHRFPFPVGQCDQNIEALAEDQEGGLWIGTESCGLHRIHDRSVRTVSRRDGLPSDSLLGLAGDADGAVWIGNRDAIMARLAPGRPIERLACAAGLPCDSCWDIAPGAGGTAWVVCGSSELLHWDGQAMQRAALPAGLEAIDMVAVARDGALWLARQARVVRWHQGIATRIEAQETLAGKRIPYQGASGTMWIAADDGVASWRDGVVRLLKFGAGETVAEASNLYEDRAGGLWIGTKGAGLRLVRGQRTALIRAAQGLPTDWIVQVLEDNAGRLWLSSSKGLFWLERHELEQLADGRRARVRPNLYDGTDGVLMRTEPFGHPAGWKGPDGRLWFASFGGAVVVDPASLRAPAPRVLIQELRVDGRPVEVGAGAVPVLGPGPRDVEVVFGALSFEAPETIWFRHRLHGRDADWIEAGANRSALYQQLPPGHYGLVVEARHRDGRWGGPGPRLQFVVRPPFYRSFWFVPLVALSGGLMLAGLHRMRLRRARAGLQAVMAERSRIARDIHDTLAQAFVATSVRLECLDQALEGEDRATMRRHLETAKQVVKDSLEEARRAVWVLRPQVLERGLPAALESLVGGASGETVVELEVTGPPRPLPPLVEANLLRIAQEGVANAYRHARAQRIVLRLSFSARLLELSVIDDGTGLPAGGAGGPPPERGLAGMRERAVDIGGTLSIEDRPGGGTAVHVQVPA